MCHRRIGVYVARWISLFFLRDGLTDFGKIAENVRVHRHLSFVNGSQLDVARRCITNKHTILVHNGNTAQPLVVQQNECIRRVRSIHNANHILLIGQACLIQSLGKILTRDCIELKEHQG